MGGRWYSRAHRLLGVTRLAGVCQSPTDVGALGAGCRKATKVLEFATVLAVFSV